jgi:hypothetical protein
MSKSAPSSNPQDTQNWLKTSVQTFFATCNWENRSPEMQQIQISSLLEEGIPLTLDLSVGQFFTAVNWEGVTLKPASAAATPSAADLAAELAEFGLEIPAKDTFTLTDFSDLF